MKKFLAMNETVEGFEQKFLLSERSFNSCDRNVGFIEKERKMATQLYTPERWAKLIDESKKKDPKFNVVVMILGNVA